MKNVIFGLAGVLAACSPQDVLSRQGSTLRSTDYVQVGIEEKRKADAKKEEEAKAKREAEQTLQAHVDRGNAHLDLFEYEAAMAEYKEAYRISQDTQYLLKIGDAYRATGDCVEAQNLYNQYLHKQKEAAAGKPPADAKAVQAKIDEANACHEKAGSNLDEIRKHYKTGVTHYDLAEYDKAATEFKEAYRLSNDPAYLFNIAQAYRMAKRCDDARTFYERFLTVSPDASNKEKIQARIAEMKACGRSK